VPVLRVVLFALLLAVLSDPAAAKPPCASPEQVKAAQLRQLHYELQVAALNCRGDVPEMPGKWQSYVHRHGGTLNDNARVLRDYFQGAAAFDRHNTVVTNRESVRVHETPGYCETHTAIFDKVLGLNGPQLSAYASEAVGDPMEIRACSHKPEAAKVKKTKG
jgi:hypothetical protein